VLLFEFIAEQKLAEAAREGAFDHLPGAGKPLPADDAALVPEELRAAYRILKNAGFVPPEVEARREAAALRRLMGQTTDDAERRRAAVRLALIEAALEKSGRRHAFDDYRDRALYRLSGTRGDAATTR
jgi:hypothetical protein